MTDFLQHIVNGLTIGSLYALIAVVYTVVYGIVQLINFAHGEVFMIGAFGALATWTVLFKGQTGLWVLPVMVLGAVLVSVLTAVVMERIAYRPLRGAPRLAPLITAIGISVFLQEAVRWWDHWLKDQDTGMMDEPMLRVWMQEIGLDVPYTTNSSSSAPAVPGAGPQQ